MYQTYEQPPKSKPARKVLFWVLGLLLFLGAVVGGTIVTWIALHQTGTPTNSAAVPTQMGAISSSLNDSPPTYVKDVVVLKEGYKVFAGYFILADKNGQPTIADGRLLFEVYTEGNELAPLLSVEAQIYKSDFSKTTIGLGSFARETVLWDMGRVAYSNFKRQPTTFSGIVKVTFTTSSGEKLIGQDTILFDK